MMASNYFQGAEQMSDIKAGLRAWAGVAENLQQDRRRVDQLREAADHIEAKERRIAELEAARIAYANEFPLNADGEPDVGSIHQNIRALKAQITARDNQTPSGWISNDEVKMLADGLAVRALITPKENYNGHAPLFISPPAPANAIDADIDEIMTQIQEFASSWSLVGGRFDDGSMLEVADDSKENIRKLIIDAMKAAK